MPQWRVHLQGEQFDLEELREVLANIDPTIIQDDSDYYLTSTEWNQSEDFTDIHNRAKEFTKLLEDAAHLHSSNTGPLTIGGIVRIGDDGRKHRILMAETGDYVLVGERAQLLLTPQNHTPVQEHSLTKTLRVSVRSPVVRDAIHFYRRGDWVNFYKVYELIKDDVYSRCSPAAGRHSRKNKPDREITSRNWISEKALSRFKGTAQSRDAVGDDARHASHQYKGPAKAMSLSEAKDLISKLLHSWIDSLVP